MGLDHGRSAMVLVSWWSFGCWLGFSSSIEVESVTGFQRWVESACVAKLVWVAESGGIASPTLMLASLPTMAKIQSGFEVGNGGGFAIVVGFHLSCLK